MRENKKIGVYLLHNKETGEAYVGSGDLSARKNNHFNALESGKHFSKRVQQAYDDNPNFDFISLETETREHAYELEQSILDDNVNNPLLLNQHRKAMLNPNPPSEETRRKISEAFKGKKFTPEHAAKIGKKLLGNKHCLGAIPDAETRAKRSQSLKGRIISQEHKDILRVLQTGKVMSNETREKISKANKGRVKTPEELEKLRISATGKKHTEESKLKISKIHKGKIIPVEVRLKMSISHTGVTKSKDHVEKVAVAHYKPFVIDGVSYKSRNEYAEINKVSIATASRKAKQSNNINGVKHDG